jgi:hypothetical protein
LIVPLAFALGIFIRSWQPGPVVGKLVPAVVVPSIVRWFFTASLMSKTQRRFDTGQLPGWHCGYDVGVQAPRGRCPECGHEFDYVALRWRRFDFFGVPLDLWRDTNGR